MKAARGCGVTRARHQRAMLAGVLAIVLMMSWRGECWAYIDPNAGGFLAQILAPFAAVLLSFLFYCRRQVARFAKSVRDRWKGIQPRDSATKAKE